MRDDQTAVSWLRDTRRLHLGAGVARIHAPLLAAHRSGRADRFGVALSVLILHCVGTGCIRCGATSTGNSAVCAGAADAGCSSLEGAGGSTGGAAGLGGIAGPSDGGIGGDGGTVIDQRSRDDSGD